MSKRYGLILPPSKQNKAPANKPAPKLDPASVFGDDDDDDSQPATTIKKKPDLEAQALQQQALAEDPSIFDYDAAFDEIQSNRKQAEESKRAVQKDKRPKYINSLLDAAKQREMEYDLYYERKLQKEEAKEAELYGDKERYLTSAYKEQLKKRRQWEAEQEAVRKREESEDVVKRGTMEHFYSNFLSKNVMGTQKKPEPSSTKKSVLDRPSPPPSPEPIIRGRHGKQDQSNNDSDEEDAKPEPQKRYRGRGRELSPSPEPIARDKRIAGKQQQQQQQQQSRAVESESESEGENERPTKRQRGASPDHEPTAARSSSADTTKAAGSDEAKPAPQQPKRNKFERSNTEESINAARERYLQRKALRASGLLLPMALVQENHHHHHHGHVRH